MYLTKEKKNRSGNYIILIFKSLLFLYLQGLVDTSKEIEKLDKRYKNLTSQQSKLVEAMAKDDYETKVPESIRNSNSEKVRERETLRFRFNLSKEHLIFTTLFLKLLYVLAQLVLHQIHFIS